MRIADWFKKDIKIKVLAFLVALLFWLYVSNVTNPFKTITIYNVPVTEVNKEFPSARTTTTLRTSQGHSST